MSYSLLREVVNLTDQAISVQASFGEGEATWVTIIENVPPGKAYAGADRKGIFLPPSALLRTVLVTDRSKELQLFGPVGDGARIVQHDCDAAPREF